MKKLLTTVLTIVVPLLHSKAQEIFEQRNDQFVRSLDDSYVRGLLFLQSTQNEDGTWSDTSYGSQPGVLGMAVLAFLSRGDDPEFGTFSKSVKNAVQQILQKQNKETGYIGTSMYNHGFATLALAEYYGLSNDTSIGPALKKATNLIVSAQKTNPKGAWRYSPDSKDADTTVTGAQMVALFAARNAGIEVPDQAISKGKNFSSNVRTKEVVSDTLEIQEPIFHALPLVPSSLLSIKILILMHLKILLNIYVKTHASEIRVTSFTAFITPHRLCLGVRRKTGTNGI